MEDKKKVYTVPVRYVFKGEFKIKADSREQAEEYAYKHCGLVLGGDIHTTLPEETVNWEFPVHPEKIVGEASQNVIAEVNMLKSLITDYHNRDIDDVIPVCDDMAFYIEKLLQKMGV